MIDFEFDLCENCGDGVVVEDEVAIRLEYLADNPKDNYRGPLIFDVPAETCILCGTVYLEKKQSDMINALSEYCREIGLQVPREFEYENAKELYERIKPKKRKSKKKQEEQECQDN